MTTDVSGEQLKRSKLLKAVFLAAVLAPLLYVFSIGPVSVLLLHHGGTRGYLIWQAVYGDPLGKLPRSLRTPVNRYLAFSDRMYWKLRGS